jgi:hypothetical protein
MNIPETLRFIADANHPAAWQGTRDKIAQDEREAAAKARALREIGKGSKLRHARAAFARKILKEGNA